MMIPSVPPLRRTFDWAGHREPGKWSARASLLFILIVSAALWAIILGLIAEAIS